MFLLINNKILLIIYFTNKCQEEKKMKVNYLLLHHILNYTNY